MKAIGKVLTFKHTFANGHRMSLIVNRTGAIPTIKCKPRKLTFENHDALDEYCAWRNEVTEVLCRVLGLEELTQLMIYAIEKEI